MKIECLDKGYVRMVHAYGSDVDVSNAARVSYDKESTELTEGDKRLIAYLAREDHTSPFRHVSINFEIYAPMMIARQWWKYVAGSDHTMDAWNESSRRYITENPEFYIPARDEWRSAPDNSKQGSGEPVDSEREGAWLTADFVKYVEEGVRLYDKAMDRGVAPEQARLFLPSYGMYVRWRWVGSLQSIAHLVKQRTAKDSQYEFQQYAKAVRDIATEAFPYSMTHLTGVTK
jgi:thymidylate synthase (FAD)